MSSIYEYYIVASCCTFHSITISSLSYVQTLRQFYKFTFKILKLLKFLKSLHVSANMAIIGC
jgi:hypothetical protein